MKKPSRILVGIDGSDDSLRAADYAMELAKSNHAEVLVVSVLDITSIFKILPRETKKQMIALGKQDAGRIFVIVQKMAEKKGLDAKTEVIESSSSAADAIINYAKRKGADMIVVGTKGRSGMSKALLGSVASKVVMHSPCPVLVVK